MAEGISTRENKDWAIAIVHGIGTPEPGDTRKNLCDAIQLVKKDFQRVEEPGASPKPDEVPPPMQTWRFAGGQARVAEVFWGDLSLVRGTVTDMLMALCINLYGAVYVNSRTLEATSKFTRILPTIPFALVRWVVLPLHLVALALAVPMALWIKVRGADPLSGDFLTTDRTLFLWLVAAGVFAGLSATAWLILRQPHRIRPQPWDFTLAFTICVLLSGAFALQPVTDWFNGCVTTHKGENWGLVGIFRSIGDGRLDVGKAVCDLIVANTPIEEGTPRPGALSNEVKLTGIGRYIALNEFAGDVAFFISAALVLVYIVLAFATWAVGSHERARAMFLVVTISILFIIATAMLLETIDFFTRLIQLWGLEKFKIYWYELAFGVWVVVVAIGAVVALTLRKVRQRPSAADSSVRDKMSAEAAYSRLIVSEFFQFTVIGATSLFILIFLGKDFLLNLFPEQYEFVPYQLIPPALFVALVLLVVLFGKELRLGLDIAMDVVNHFVDPKRSYPIRRSISSRFYETLDKLIRDGDRPHLLIIAHSQGTVITVDALMHGLWSKQLTEHRKPLSELVASMTILTFGSPITHIYQHYFPRDYGAFSETGLKDLAADKRVRWLNIYRADDPVGTTISGPTPDFPENIRMPAGGHLRYWEEDVAKALREHLPGKP